MSSRPSHRCCIVTPDIVGPIRNGGIGTHAFALAQRLANEGIDVDILFTGPFENSENGAWRERFKTIGVNFIALKDQAEPEHQIKGTPLMLRAWRVHQFLQSRQYNSIHFQDWQANGFFTIQARQVLGAYPETNLILTLHSNTRWIADGSRQWLSHPIDDCMTAWMEAYCARYADIVVSPCGYMQQAVLKQGWQLAPDTKIIPYVLPPTERLPLQAAQPGEVAFFGRLETRKGLEEFVAALVSLDKADKAKLGTVHFVGKPGRVEQERGDHFINRSLAGSGISFRIETTLESAEAITYLRENGVTAFLPSQMDNLPFAMLECCWNGIDLRAARTGGIPEILPDEKLFVPIAKDIRRSLLELLNAAPTPTSCHYDADAAFNDWLDVTRALPKTRVNSSVKTRPDQSRITVCVPYYNYGAYLEDMLESLTQQTVQVFDVIVINDGSTDPDSVAAFERAAEQYAGPRYTFSAQENAGVGATRNKAASLAKTDYLVFMDADNIAKPDMLETFLQAIEHTGADVLTCHFDGFPEHSTPTETTTPLYTYMPIGPCIEAGWRENVFGDANFIIKRDVFEAARGFGIERTSSWEDWELLARLALAGYKQDVVPRSLFWYRHTDQGFSRNTRQYTNARRVLRAYADAAPPALRPIFMDVLWSQMEADRGLRFAVQHALKSLRNRFSLNTFWSNLLALLRKAP